MHILSIKGPTTSVKCIARNRSRIKTDCKEGVALNKRMLFKRAISAIIALIPFGIIKLTEKIWFSDQYLFEWMSRRHYLFIWVIALLAAIAYKWIGYAIAYSFFVSFWIGVIGGSVISTYRENWTPLGMNKTELMYWRFDKGFYIWICSFVFLMLGCMIVFLIIRHKKKKRAKYMDIYNESLNRLETGKHD